MLVLRQKYQFTNPSNHVFLPEIIKAKKGQFSPKEELS